MYYEMTINVIKNVRKNLTLLQSCKFKKWEQLFSTCTPSTAKKPRHLICFKQWTPEMVLKVLNSAMNLKRSCRDTHHKRMDVLKGSKVMILQEVNEPVLNMAVSKASTLLGAYDVNIVDKVIWEHDYNGRLFSLMTDIIFVCTRTHMCVQRFADQSSVPVVCMSSRTHASIQSLSTVMAVMEEFGKVCSLNVSYLGPPAPVLNSYLLLCPMLGANIRFKCCCEKCPVSPLLYKASETMCSTSKTVSKECKNKDELFHEANVVIAGPTHEKKSGVFTLSSTDIERHTGCKWIFFHTCPRGPEVDDHLFRHSNSRTFNAFENMHFIAAALMANALKDKSF